MNNLRVIIAGLAFIVGLVSPVVAQDQFANMKESCTACHDAAAATEVPDLGGIDSYYALLQLVAFQEGQHKNEIMNSMVADFSDNDLRAAADWVATLPRPAPPEDPPDLTRMEAGAALSAANRCNTCHGYDYLGGHQMPPLRNQRESYI